MQVQTATSHALAAQKRPELTSNQQARPAEDQMAARRRAAMEPRIENVADRSLQARLDAMKAVSTSKQAIGDAKTAAGQADSTSGSAVEGFMKAWGTDNPEYDLNADGVVDGADLGMFLSGMNQPKSGENAALANPSSPPPDELPSVEGIMKAWGSDNPDYDLNGDGIVDGKDLGIVLSSQNGESGNGATEPASENVAAAKSDVSLNSSDQPQPDMPTVDELMEAWGTDSESFDLNSDGIVDGADLGILLASMDGSGQSPDSPAADVAASAAGEPTLPGGTLNETAMKISDTILASMNAEGQQRIDAAAFNGPSGLLDSLDPDGTGAILKDNLTGAVESSLRHAHAANPDFNLSNMVERWTGMFGGGPEPTSAGADTKPAQQRDMRLDQIADNMTSRLAELGFEQSPPSDIREIIDQMQLSGFDKQALMSKLTDRFPEGLGLNAVG